MLRNGDSLKAAFAGSNKHIAPHEIHEVRALQQKLRHPGIVVLRPRYMTVRASLGFLPAHGMRHECRKGLSAEALGRNRLLLVVEPVALAVLRANLHGAGGTTRRHPMVGHRSIDSQ